MAEKKEPAKAETTPAAATPEASTTPETKTETKQKTALVKVQFPDGTDAEGKQTYRTQEVSRELAETQLALPETAPKEQKEGEVLKLRNPAWKGAKLVK